MVQEVVLTFAGESSTYTGSLTPVNPGQYVLEVLAMQPGEDNFGHVIRPVRVVPSP